MLPAVLRVALFLFLVTTLLGLGTQALLPFVAPDAAAAIKTQENQARGEVIDISLGHALAVQALLLPLVLLATAFFLRRVDRLPLASIGLRLGPGALRVGLGAGAISMLVPCLWLVLAALVGGVRFNGWHALDPGSARGARAATLALYVLGFTVAALAEEIILRGYVYSTLARRYRWINAAGTSAALFALMHLGNPGVGPIALLNTFLIGMLLAAVRESSGSILPAVLAHALWNTMLGCVLSQPLSGIAAESMIDLQVGGNAYVTGAAYGPEASILVTGLLVPLLFLAVIHAAGGDDAANEGSELPD